VATWDWTVRDDVVALRVHQQHRIDGGDARDRAPELVGAQMTEVRIARVAEKALEAPHPRRGQIAELTEIAGDHAAPERDIDLTVASRRFAFAPQRIDRGGHRVAVQRHVDQRGDAGRRRGCRRGGEALPVGTRLIDVHVRVDEARHEDRRAGEPNLFSRRIIRADRTHRQDHAVGHRHSGGPELAVDDGPFGPDDEIH